MLPLVRRPASHVFEPPDLWQTDRAPRIISNLDLRLKGNREFAELARWSKGDSNSRSHRERSGHGRAPRTNHRHRARAHLIVPASLFDSTWDREFESPLLQR